MPYYDEITRLVGELTNNYGPSGFDFLRRAFLKELSGKTGRATILYAMNTDLDDEPIQDVQISINDVHGMMAVMPGMTGTDLDLILHTNGGSGEAAKAIIDYLRQRFSNIRVIVPMVAMSAGTMLACGA